ncbi:MAG: acetate--CoA ligase family protein, partial [Acidimicrobiaceae bacterium]
SCSGGEASLVADLSEKTSLRFEPFTDEHYQRINSTLTELVTIGNPFDYHTFMWGDRDATANTFTEVMSGHQDATMLVLDTPPRDDQPSDSWTVAAQALGDAVAKTNKRGVVVATIPECITDDVRVAARAANMTVLQGLQESLAALDAAAWLGTNMPGELPATVIAPRTTKLSDEAESKKILATNGVAVPVGVRANRNDLKTAAEKIGYPVTLKGLGLAHKSEVGAVRVGIKNADELTNVASQMPKEISEFLIEQTVTNIVAEVLVSVRRDAPVGWLITLGAGGIFTELWRDTVCLLAPSTDSEIKQALKKLRIAPLLNGFRGKPAADVDSLVGLIQKLIDTALKNELVEVELNPVLVTTNSAIAVDALMIAEVR